jgi:type IX secretion system PorP/SprF family membrane protein
VKFAFSQDPVYSQFYNAPLQLNPAMAGNNSNPFFSGNIRIQWPGISNAYATYSASYDQFLPNSNSGIGFSLLNDSAGDGTLRHTKVSGIYSYNLRINRKSYLRGGVEVGLVSKRLNWDKLVFGDALDPQFGAISPGGTPYPSKEVQPGNTDKTVFDLGVGFLYYSPTFYAGIAIDHLNNPSDEFLSNEEKNFPGIPPRFTFHGGTEFTLDQYNKKDLRAFISPNVLFVKQGGFTQLNIGAYAEINQLIAGLSYRHSNQIGDALIFSAGARMGYFKIAYSFDFTVSDLSVTQGGAHELGIIYNLGEGFRDPVDIQDCLNIFR